LNARKDESGNSSCNSVMISCKYIWYIPSGKTSVEKHESKTAQIHETKQWVCTHYPQKKKSNL